MEQLTDTYYIDKIQAGETDCFAVLLERYSQPVFSLIVKVIGCREDAEELTQDVFLKVFRSLNTFQGESRFSTWLYRIAYNTAISAVRKKKLEWISIDETPLKDVTDEAFGAGLIENSNEVQLVCLEKALNQLLPGERALILFFYMQEKSIEEIAVITGYSVANVKTKLFRIRKKLFTLMNSLKDKDK